MDSSTVDGFPAVALSAGDLDAVFVPEAGMIGVSLRHRGEELLGQRAGLEAYVERGKTMGIPLLYPWANRLSGDDYPAGTDRVVLPAEATGLRRDPHGLPIHGLLAASPDWEVTDTGPAHLSATLDFAARPDRLRLFPFPHVVTVDVALEEDALSIETHVKPTGVFPVPVAFGWHPYLQLPGVPRAEWRLELPPRRHLPTDERGIPTGESEAVPARTGPLGEEAYDDGYDELADPVMALSGGGRRVAVRLVSGYPVTQVFAPPGQDLVALEPMTAPTNALRSSSRLPSVAPGKTFTATFTIEVTKE